MTCESDKINGSLDFSIFKIICKDNQAAHNKLLNQTRSKKWTLNLEKANGPNGRNKDEDIGDTRPVAGSGPAGRPSLPVEPADRLCERIAL
jgi:hypothetical protein